jgi:hypothetical protein
MLANLLYHQYVGDIPYLAASQSLDESDDADLIDAEAGYSGGR